MTVSPHPGWRWSTDVVAALGQVSCRVKHTVVVSGSCTAAMDDGTVYVMKAGELFNIAPGHDSWVVGDEPYISLHFEGGESYASHK